VCVKQEFVCETSRLDVEGRVTAAVWSRARWSVWVAAWTATSCNGAFGGVSSGSADGATFSCRWVVWTCWARDTVRVARCWWLLSWGWVRVWGLWATRCWHIASVHTWIAQTTLNPINRNQTRKKRGKDRKSVSLRYNNKNTFNIKTIWTTKHSPSSRWLREFLLKLRFRFVKQKLKHFKDNF